MKKFKILKGVIGVATVAVIGISAAFAGTHWDGIKKIAQGPVYSDAEVEEKVNAGTSQGSESGYSKGYTEGFNDGVEYVPPEPEIETVNIPNYAEIESCPDNLKEETSIKQYRLDDDNVLICQQEVDSSIYVFNSKTQEFKRLMFGNQAKLLYKKDKKLLISDTHYVTIIDYENIDTKTTIFKNQNENNFAVVVETDYGVFLSSREGLRKINMEEMTQTEINTEIFFSFFVKYKNFIYYKTDNELVKFDTTDNSITTITEEMSDSAVVIDRVGEYVFLSHSTYSVGAYLLKLDTGEFTVIHSSYIYKIDKVYNEYVLIGTKNNRAPYAVLNMKDGSVQFSDNDILKSEIVYEDDDIILISGYLYCVIFNKSTGVLETVSTSNRVYKVIKSDTNGLILLTNSTDFVFIDEAHSFKKIYTDGVYDTIKKVKENTWQLTSSTDSSLVIIFNEETKVANKFLLA